MLKVKMLKTISGSLDGINSRTFQEGSTYEISESLVKDFKSLNAIELCERDEKSVSESPSNKALGSSNYQNKAVKPKQSKGDDK